jgi:hypothetical protein
VRIDPAVLLDLRGDEARFTFGVERLVVANAFA